MVRLTYNFYHVTCLARGLKVLYNLSFKKCLLAGNDTKIPGILFNSSIISSFSKKKTQKFTCNSRYS